MLFLPPSSALLKCYSLAIHQQKRPPKQNAVVYVDNHESRRIGRSAGKLEHQLGAIDYSHIPENIPDREENSWAVFVAERPVTTTSCREQVFPSHYLDRLCAHCWSKKIESTEWGSTGTTAARVDFFFFFKSCLTSIYNLSVMTDPPTWFSLLYKVFLLHLRLGPDLHLSAVLSSMYFCGLATPYLLLFALPRRPCLFALCSAFRLTCLPYSSGI